MEKLHQELVEVKRRAFDGKVAILSRQLEDFVAFVQTFSPMKNDIWELKVRVKSVEKIWDAYLNPPQDVDTQFCSEYTPNKVSLMGQQYHSALSKANCILETYEIFKNESASSKSANIKTESKDDEHEKPPVHRAIELPVFYGGQEEWLGFRDSFEKSINHNPAIETLQKFRYLRSFLGGDAARLISSYEVEEGNYEKAWSAVKKKYNEPIIQHHITCIQECEPIKGEPADIRRLVDEVSKHFQHLIELNYNEGEYNATLTWSVLHKLDKKTKEEFEDSITGIILLRWDALKNFLTGYCKKLENPVPDETDEDILYSLKPFKGTYT